MNSMKIKLNNVLLTGRIDGTDNFEVTLRREDNFGRTARSFSSELVFFDDGYQILKAALIDPVNGYGLKVDVKIYDDCCSEPVFVGVIRGDAIDWCEPDCSITASVIEEDLAYNCLQSKVITKNLFDNYSPSYVNLLYCIEGRPKFLHIIGAILLSIIGFVVSTVLLPFVIVIITIAAVIYVLCSIVCFLPLTDCTQDDCDDSQINPANTVDLIQNLVDDAVGFFDTCNRKHPSVLLREYLKAGCQQCGLNFSSSILTDPSSIYFNTVLWAASVEKGKPNQIISQDLIAENWPIETMETFLDNVMKPTFNADYALVGNTLVFERKDFFNTTTQWIDAEQLLNDSRIVDNQVCFSWIDRERWAFGRFEYNVDALDIIGNEAKLRFNDIVDFNVPYNPTQTGQLNVSLPLSPARFRSDDVDNEGTIFNILEAFQGGLLLLIFGGQFANQNKKSMLLNNHCGFNYKLLIWDGQDREFSIIKNDYSDTFTGGPVLVDGVNVDPDDRFNYPFWFKENNANNLYSLFHYIDDPRNPSASQFNFKFTFQFDCSDLTSFDWSKTIRLTKNGSVVFGRVREVKINFIDRTMSIQGIV
jgi:hypothetical protein